ncbi:putative membrane protein [Candidatus Nanohalobium constans]|uniref:Putative membrane protein n=2 Tax=Candidatus Nanohalobium constans TaxID=2565781 RepID=A0A5Q0UGK4_9ARCH|nr:putative membrane protein [Candidatus Nanohalobium constans]
MILMVLTLVFMASLSLSATDSDQSDVSVGVDATCGTTAYRFDFAGSQSGRNVVGEGGSGYFSFLPFNSGEMSFTNMSLEITNSSGSEIFYGEPQQFSKENFTETYLFNSTNRDAEYSTSKLKDDVEGNDGYFHYKAPYSHNVSKDGPPFNATPRILEFKAEYEPGNYTGTLNLDHQCEFRPQNSSSIVSNVFNGTFGEARESDNISSGDTSDLNLDLAGLPISRINFSVNQPYARTTPFNYSESVEFDIVVTEGTGESPNQPADENEAEYNLDLNALIDALEQSAEVNTSIDEEQSAELKADAIVEELRKAANISQALEETQYANYSSDALIQELNRTGQVNTDVNRTENASLDTDAEETSNDAEPKEGDGNFPGQTPEPEPEPTPEPTPLLSVDLRPLNTSYTADRGTFTEVGMEVNNTGEETLSDLELSPRFSEGMDWQSQSVTIDSLEVGGSVNRSVFVNPGEGVEPGIYQVPVYASTPDEDIGSQYVNVEVTEEPAQTSGLSISEAPQDIRFEMGNNYTVPVLLENSGDNDLENVSIELQNTENCGDYTADEIESIAAGETASVSVNFNTSDNLQECQATIVASSTSGSFAFSEMTVETVEEKGIVPEEFRVPIIASLWTAMLIVYTVVIKRYGMDSLTVKVPMVLLILGETFILIYLSSAYYEILPPGLLPFSSA